MRPLPKPVDHVAIGEAEDGFDLYFPDYDSLLRYCKKKFKRWNTGNSPPA